MKRITANVSGRVQGVGYRYFVTDRAREFGVKGYAKNLADDSVEVVAEGAEPDLREFIRSLHAQEDPAIRVDKIVTVWEDAPREFSGFGIRPLTCKVHGGVSSERFRHTFSPGGGCCGVHDK